MSEDMNDIRTPLDRLLEWSNEAGEGRAPEPHLVRQHDLAHELGVTDKRIATWRARSARNGFPDPVACHFGPTTRGGKRRHMLWDLNEVRAWFEGYDEAAQRSRRGPYWDSEKAS